MSRLPKDCEEDIQAFLARQEELAWDLWTKWFHDVLGELLPDAKRPANRCLWTDLWNYEIGVERQAKARRRSFKPNVIVLNTSKPKSRDGSCKSTALNA